MASMRKEVGGVWKTLVRARFEKATLRVAENPSRAQFGKGTNSFVPLSLQPEAALQRLRCALGYAPNCFRNSSLMLDDITNLA
jgi:hypothetical protein